jgi:spermidine synthase
LAWLSGALAFLGLSYEFVLAQTLSQLVGHSVFQYTMTFATFMLGLGISALVAKPAAVNGFESLIKLQVAITLTAWLSVFILFGVSGFTPPTVLNILGLCFVFLFGLLTGWELPLLLRLAPHAHRYRILGADYLGMLAASLAFPLVLLPQLGVIGTLLALSFGNSLVAMLLTLSPRDPRPTQKIFLFVWCLLCGLGFYASDHLNRLLETWYLHS